MARDLEPGMICNCTYSRDLRVRLDHRVPGEAHEWVCDVWYERPDRPEGGYWSGDEYRAHESDLVPEETA